MEWSWLLVIQMEQQPQVYDVILLRSTKRCSFPFPGCPGSFHMWNGFHLHFKRQNWAVGSGS